MSLPFKIETIKVDEDSYPIDIVEELVIEHGKCKRIGYGSYASVYGSKRSNIVYKIGHVCDNAAYLSYINVIKKSRNDNPFFPKIYGMRVYTNKHHKKNRDLGNDVFIIAMERLAPINKLHRPLLNWVETYFAEKLGSDISWKNISSGAKLLGVDIKIPRKLQHALNAIEAACSENYYFDIDVHDENVMLRGNQIVFTDPIA